MRTVISLLCLVALGPAAPGQVDGKPQQPTATEVLAKMLAKEGLSIDKKKRLVKAEGVVTITHDFLEFVAIGPRGKKHEALVTLKCKGSMLKAALMALGYKDGKNADFKPVVPLPTEEEVMNGAPTSVVVEPKGQRVYLSLSWHDEKEGEKTYAIEDCLIDVRADNTVRNAEWVYFGGMMAPLLRNQPKVFVADYDQNYISTYYTKPDSHLITIKHERGRLDENWWPNEKLLPDPGTPCTLIFSRKPIVKRLPPLVWPKRREPKKQKDQKKDGKGK